jgi:cytoskeletal protein CcmA (bactofilin family)
MGFFNSQKEMPLPVMAEESKPQESLPPAKLASTLITQGVTIKGTIQGEGVVQVEGVVEGEFHMVGAVIVSDTGLVRGPISADVVRVAGRVEGDVTAREHMRLEQTGTLIGDVATASLVVEDGGCLNGRSTMTRAPEPDPELRDIQAPDTLQFGPDYDIEGE